jgi:5'-phosphate synthase pdxT subunit
MVVGNSLSPSAIGVLDLQGGVQEHLAHLAKIGVKSKPVKSAEDFAGLAGLIIPGGESTCLRRLLDIFDLKLLITQQFKQGLKLWGTCAGAILLAKENLDERPYFGFIDIAVKRNAFGGQLDSFQCEASVPKLASTAIPLTFIRAPKIVRVGANVEILLRLDDHIAAAETDGVLVTSFHPELTSSTAFHRYFAHKCGLITTQDNDEFAGINGGWSSTDWMRLSRKG